MKPLAIYFLLWLCAFARLFSAESMKDRNEWKVLPHDRITSFAVVARGQLSVYAFNPAGWEAPIVSIVLYQAPTDSQPYALSGSPHLLAKMLRTELGNPSPEFVKDKLPQLLSDTLPGNLIGARLFNADMAEKVWRESKDLSRGKPMLLELMASRYTRNGNHWLIRFATQCIGSDGFVGLKVVIAEGEFEPFSIGSLNASIALDDDFWVSPKLSVLEEGIAKLRKLEGGLTNDPTDKP
jgi:hypothetical protein